MENQAIEPLGESLSDFQAVGEVAKKLGLYEEFTCGMTLEDKMKLSFHNMDLDDLISWEDFQDKQYYIVPTDPEWEKVPAGLREFYEDPEASAPDSQRQAGVLLPAPGRSLPGRYRAGTATQVGGKQRFPR